MTTFSAWHDFSETGSPLESKRVGSWADAVPARRAVAAAIARAVVALEEGDSRRRVEEKGGMLADVVDGAREVLGIAVKIMLSSMEPNSGEDDLRLPDELFEVSGFMTQQGPAAGARQMDCRRSSSWSNQTPKLNESVTANHLRAVLMNDGK